MDWLNPRALIALAAAAGPVLVHLLRRQRARRVPFPTLRFVTATQAAALRLRLPSDPWLMVLRIAIVAAAALAWAQPVLITRAPGGAQAEALARAIVIDGTPSMARAMAQAQEAARAERQGATVALETTATDLHDALRHAVAALEEPPSRRREIVIVSDFQHGAISNREIRTIPAEIGLRFISVEAPPAPDGGPTLLTFAQDAQTAVAEDVRFEGPRTRVRLVSGEVTALPRIVAGPDRAAAIDALLRTVARAGTAALSADRPIAVVFKSGSLPDVTRPRADWMVRAILRLRDDPALRRAAAEHAAEPGGNDPAIPRSSRSRDHSSDRGWVTVTVNRLGDAVVAVAAKDRELVAEVAAEPSDFLAAVALRALLNAAADSPPWNEREPERISAAQLTQWTRSPADIPENRWKHQPPGDARWLWALVLGLLVVEHAWRRARRARPIVEPSAYAA